MANSDRVKYVFADLEEYKALINDAHTNASKDEDVKFTKEMIDRFERYGPDAYVSEKQIKWLKNLSSGGFDE